jgi:hypothetical protein
VSRVCVFFWWWRAPQQTLRTHRSLEAYCATLWWRWRWCPLPSNGTPVELNWQGKTEELGEKPVPASLCPPQIPHGLTGDRTRASAVGGRRLTAWAMARPGLCFHLITLRHTSQSVGLLWTRDRPVAETCTWQHKHCTRQRSMPPGGFEATIPASARPQTYALDRTATGIGNKLNYCTFTCSLLLGCITFLCPVDLLSIHYVLW